MKLCKLFLVGVLLLYPLSGKAQKNLFNTYNDMKGVSSVYISKAMIKMNPNLFAQDIYIGKVTGQLNCVQILSTMDNNIKKDMRKDIRSLVQSSKYELLMKQKGTVSSSEFYVNQKGDKVKELIMFIDGAATLKFVYLEGDMTLKDIQNIMMQQQNSNLNKNSIPSSIYQICDHALNLAAAACKEGLRGLSLEKLEGLQDLSEQSIDEFQEQLSHEIRKEIKKSQRTERKK